jgi:hypothetical protein
MKRPSDDDGDQRPCSTDSKLEKFLSGFLQRHPRFFVHLTVAIILLVILSLLAAKFFG